MNTLAQRFSSTGPLAQLEKARREAQEDDDFSDLTWGSEAGFGNVAKGVPSFNIPALADVRVFVL
jgi:20S proteasome subunit beta 5